MSQKFKLSDDQNTLVVVGGEFEGQYEATGQDGCASCSFWTNEICELKTFSTCAWTARKDQKSIIWMKKKSEKMTEAPTPAPAPTAERFSREAALARLQHRHFDLIVTWAKNPTQQVWFWNVNEWEKAISPTWKENFYSIGEKPTSPPMVAYQIKIRKFRDVSKIYLPANATEEEIKNEIQNEFLTMIGVDHYKVTI